EVEACRAALLLAAHQGWREIEIESDCSILVTALHQQVEDNYEHAISLPQHLHYFKEYQGKLNKVAGSKKEATIIKGALYLLSAGSSDFVQNYYVNPFVNKLYTPDQYGDILVGAFTRFITDVYGLGARKIGVTSRFT
ncbi:hypothetical protein ABKV19_020148, partial [Rosa sericea]